MKQLLCLLLLFGTQVCLGQKTISITIDDVPNTRLYAESGYQSLLMQKLDSLNIPIALFFNESKIFHGDSLAQNFHLLTQWAQREYVTLGNHSFSHARYSETGIEAYEAEILKGEAITRKLAEKYDKDLIHFRFPYNDLGIDSMQHAQVKAFLESHGYRITPFTVESSDWMYEAVYRHYLKKGKTEEARKIGEDYVQKTLEYVAYMEELAQADYGRSIHQIYLCHDNALNTDYLPAIVDKLEQQGYTFISLDEALTDEVYEQQDYYQGKWGFSWLYRWKKTREERVPLMKGEPSTKEIQTLYEDTLAY